MCEWNHFVLIIPVALKKTRTRYNTVTRPTIPEITLYRTRYRMCYHCENVCLKIVSGFRQVREFSRQLFDGHANALYMGGDGKPRYFSTTSRTSISVNIVLYIQKWNLPNDSLSLSTNSQLLIDKPYLNLMSVAACGYI